MIDIQTGHLILSENIHIKKDDFYDHVLSLNLGQTNKQWGHGNGWLWLQENNVFVENKYFIFQFGFYEKKLKLMSFSFSNTRFQLDEGWDNWSEEKELADLEKYKSWLTNELGKQREFSWGEAWALYDMKGGFSSLGINYK
jgi:hypothetical protein